MSYQSRAKAIFDNLGGGDESTWISSEAVASTGPRNGREQKETCALLGQEDDEAATMLANSYDHVLTPQSIAAEAARRQPGAHRSILKPPKTIEADESKLGYVAKEPQQLSDVELHPERYKRYDMDWDQTEPSNSAAAADAIRLAAKLKKKASGEDEEPKHEVGMPVLFSSKKIKTDKDKDKGSAAAKKKSTRSLLTFSEHDEEE